jgi:hypothetical protein
LEAKKLIRGSHEETYPRAFITAYDEQLRLRDGRYLCWSAIWSILLRLGVYVTPAITLELRYGDGIDDDTIMGVDYSIDRIAGLYALYHLELSSAFSIYGLVGYSEADLKAEASGGSVIEKEDDISYGIGLDLGNINFEYTHVLEDSNYEVNAASIGYTYHFE